MTHNVFLAFTFRERLMERCLCFKGDKEVPETAAEQAAAQVAIDQYNTYMEKYRPFEDKFIADVMRPTAIREQKIAGQTNADLAQKTAIPTGVDPSRIARTPIGQAQAITKAKAINAAETAVKNQKVQGMQAVTDMGMGNKAEAELGFQNLAFQSVNRAINDVYSDVSKSNAITGSVMGAVGAGARIIQGESSDKQDDKKQVWQTVRT